MVSQQDLHKAVSLLREGGLVAFPTETVYGLGADASNPDAVRKIYYAKGRPTHHPVIVHIAHINQLSNWVTQATPMALKLAEAFWPGPLTLIFKKKEGISDLITGKQDSIGIRIPNHPVAQALLQAFGGGLAAPSANRFGRISPTTAQAVQEELMDKVDFILDGGQCDVGVESTIVDVSGSQPVLLRPGMITAEQIEAVIKQPISFTQKNSPRVSGSLESHYAPVTKMKLLSGDDIVAFLQMAQADEFPLAVLHYGLRVVSQSNVECVRLSNDPRQYAHDLYATLRWLDQKTFKQILVEVVPEELEWDAIRDRLARASR